MLFLKILLIVVLWKMLYSWGVIRNHKIIRLSLFVVLLYIVLILLRICLGA